MMNQQIAHRMRCITVKVSVVNVCPECGYVTVADFHWDFGRDPSPELGAIVVDNDDTAFEVVEALQDMAPTVHMPCLPCEEA